MTFSLPRARLHVALLSRLWGSFPVRPGTLVSANDAPTLARVGFPKSGSAAQGSLTALWSMTAAKSSILPDERHCDKLQYCTSLPVP